MKHPYKAIIFCMITFYIEIILLKHFGQYNYISWIVGYSHALLYNMYIEKLMQDK